ncbi:hypothetical protein AB6A40_010191 [Gnathostoma spinigerum]|uniref:Uncharacterized protein n=1 Tax=Gnathostoma spinigerum TaxID=75299 RepID=A0ABD6F288_9BILA
MSVSIENYYTSDNQLLVVLSNLEINNFQVLSAKRSKTDQRIIIVVEALPSHGQYEATLEMKDNLHPIVISSVTRDDAYGSQGDCVSDESLKPLCYCKSHVEDSRNLNGYNEAVTQGAYKIGLARDGNLIQPSKNNEIESLLS